MDRLTIVRLHGPLAEAYGAEHQFMIRNPREAVFALDANYPGFRADFIALEHYGIQVDGDWWQPTPGNEDPGATPVSRELDIVPLIEGRAFLGAGLIGALIPSLAGTTAASIIGGLVIAAVLVGISLLLSPKPKKKEAEDEKKEDSYIFSGPENVTEQGVAVPLIYGRCHVGSVVISAGLETTQLLTTGDPNYAAGQGGVRFIDPRQMLMPAVLQTWPPGPIEPDLPQPRPARWSPVNA